MSDETKALIEALDVLQDNISAAQSQADSIREILERMQARQPADGGK